ncbi:MAG: hypothetical protein AAFQ34_14530, partial [Pseudomonadota bacterium]
MSQTAVREKFTFLKGLKTSSEALRNTVSLLRDVILLLIAGLIISDWSEIVDPGETLIELFAGTAAADLLSKATQETVEAQDKVMGVAKSNDDAMRAISELLNARPDLESDLEAIQ